MKKLQKKIIVVDDNNPNLTACKNILKPHYEVFTVPSAAKMFDLLEHVMPDLILLDVDMPDVNGYEAAGKLKKSDQFKKILIIFQSGRVAPRSEIFGLNMGALDYIHKPFVSELLLKRIETHMSLQDTNKTIREMHTPLKEIIGLLDEAAQTGDNEKTKENINKANSVSKNLLSLIDAM